MDVAAAVSANRHCRRVVVTAAVNNVSFDRPIKLGEVVIIESQVTRAFNSSMEVYLEVFVENATTGERSRCNEAYYTFVAVDQLGVRLPCRPLVLSPIQNGFVSTERCVAGSSD